MKYKLHDIGDEEFSPELGDYLSMYVTYMNSQDSIFYESAKFKYNKVDVHLLESVEEGSFEEVLMDLKLSDSAEVYINASTFFGDYVGADVPPFIDSTEELTIQLRILKIQDEATYLEELEAEKDFMEMKEFQVLNDYLDNSGIEFDTIGGVYVALLSSPQEDGVGYAYGDLITLHYEARFLENNNLFYSTYRNGYPDEYNYGVPGQLIEGVQKGLSGRNVGDSLLIVVPSSLGFGDEPSAGNMVPPYSALKYTVKVEAVGGSPLEVN